MGRTLLVGLVGSGPLFSGWACAPEQTIDKHVTKQQTGSTLNALYFLYFLDALLFPVARCTPYLVVVVLSNYQVNALGGWLWSRGGGGSSHKFGVLNFPNQHWRLKRDFDLQGLDFFFFFLLNMSIFQFCFVFSNMHHDNLTSTYCISWYIVQHVYVKGFTSVFTLVPFRTIGLPIFSSHFIYFYLYP